MKRYEAKNFHGLWVVMKEPEGYIRKIFDTQAQAERYEREKNENRPNK